MYCLYCGNCCKTMSPISHPEPCPHIIEKDTFGFCSKYTDRPIECQNHEYQTRFCPIGLSVLQLNNETDTDKIRLRIDTGWGMIKGCSHSGASIQTLARREKVSEANT